MDTKSVKYKLLNIHYRLCKYVSFYPIQQQQFAVNYHTDTPKWNTHPENFEAQEALTNTTHGRMIDFFMWRFLLYGILTQNQFDNTMFLLFKIRISFLEMNVFWQGTLPITMGLLNSMKISNMDIKTLLSISHLSSTWISKEFVGQGLFNPSQSSHYCMYHQV